jgi:hypothetical protein
MGCSLFEKLKQDGVGMTVIDAIEMREWVGWLRRTIWNLWRFWEGMGRREISIMPLRRECQSHTSQLFGVAKVKRTGFEQEVARCE